MGVSIGQVLRQAALRFPDRVAVVDLGQPTSRRKETTFATLDDNARRAAKALAEHGLGPGSRVGLLGDNGRSYVEAWFGIVYAGAAVVPIPTVASPDEVAVRLAHARCDALVADDARYEVAVQALEQLGREIPHVDVEGLALGALPIDRPFDTRPEDLAAILYTSATLGQPRGAAISHASLATHTAALVHHVLRLGPESRVLGALPLAHSYGIRMSVLCPFYAGGRVVLLPRFDAARAWHAIVDEKITWLPAVPTMLAALAREETSGRPDALEWCLSAGAPLSEPLRVAAEAKLGVDVRQGYGLTEATFCAIDAPPEPRRPGTVGRAVWGVELRVVDEAGADVAAGVTGEIRVRGQNVMTEYVDDLAGTVAATPDGWLATGDLGVLSDDGVLSVVDRKKDLILRGGNNVSPAAIEAALLLHDGVAEAAVVGRPDSYYGEEIVAVVVAAAGREPPTAKELAEHAAARLSALSVPREWAFVPRLPVSTNGKVVKRELRRLLAEGVLATERA